MTSIDNNLINNNNDTNIGNINYFSSNGKAYITKSIGDRITIETMRQHLYQQSWENHNWNKSH